MYAYCSSFQVQSQREADVAMRARWFPSILTAYLLLTKRPVGLDARSPLWTSKAPHTVESASIDLNTSQMPSVDANATTRTATATANSEYPRYRVSSSSDGMITFEVTTVNTTDDGLAWAETVTMEGRRWVSSDPIAAKIN
jgi:hypothetical protein